MERIYEQLKDLHITAVIVYAIDGKAYEDAEGTIGVPTETLKDLFLKNVLVINVDGALHRATGFTEDGAVYAESTITEDGAVYAEGTITGVDPVEA